MTRSALSKDLLQAVSFRLGQEEYALEITQVKEVIMPTGIMRMPQTATFNVGVINLRGTIIPVIDLRLRLGVGEATTDDHTRILIAKPAGRVVGLIVDAVSQVMKVPRDEVVPPPATIVGAARRYLRGIARRADGRMVILLDIEAALDPQELIAAENAEAAALAVQTA